MEKMIHDRIVKIAEKIEELDWRDERLYACYMSQIYYYSRNSTRLLALASGLFPFGQEALHFEFAAHIPEERAHEKLALKDLNALGYEIGDWPELPSTQAFYQCHYYQVEHRDPICLLGYILALETLAVTRGRWHYDLIVSIYGAKAGNFIRTHAFDDEDHVKKMYAVLDRLDDRQRGLVLANFDLTCHLLEKFIEGVAEHANHARLGKTA